MSLDTLTDVWQMLIREERENDEVNSMAAAFRKMKLLNLMKYYMKWRSHKTKEDPEQEAKQLVLRWIRAEIWSRSFLSGIWRKAKEALVQVYVSWKYKGLFDIIRTAAEKYN